MRELAGQAKECVKMVCIYGEHGEGLVGEENYGICCEVERT